MWGTLPPEKNGAKNVQNLGRFRTTNDLGSPVGGLGVMWPPQWVRDKARAASAFLCNLRSKIASDSDAFSYFHATFLVPAEGGGWFDQTLLCYGPGLETKLHRTL